MNHLSIRFTMKLAGAAAVLGAVSVPCQAAPLFSNASANPSVPALNARETSLSGIAAPAGAGFSEAQQSDGSHSNAVAGIAAQAATTGGVYRFADDFTVPFPGWRVDQIAFLAYQPGSLGPGCPFGAVNFRLWDARPGSANAHVILGDTQTNVLQSTASTGVYRIFNSVVPPFPVAPDTTRLIWQLNATCRAYLPAGTYWVDFQVESLDPSEPAFIPTATVASSRGAAGFNAVQFRTSTAHRTPAWEAIIDPGKPAESPDLPQDLPFLVIGEVGCPADFNLDMAVDIFDYLDFLDAFIANDLQGDFNHDSVVDLFDYLDFVAALAEGC